MKFFAVFVLLAAGIAAESQPHFQVGERNIITDQIIEVIEDVIEGIRDLGLDPLHIKKEAGSYALPVPVLFSAGGLIEDLLTTGLSDIVVNHINYDVLRFLLTFELELPHIHLSAGTFAGEAVIFGNQLHSSVGGSVDIRNTKVSSVIRVGILGGISIRSVDIDFNLGTIDSRISMNVLDYDISEPINQFLSGTIPGTFAEFKREVDELIAIVLLDIINDNL